MARPTITYSSMGSNTAASGAGPATAHTGSAHNNGSGTTIYLPSADYSDVATDGSAAIWLNVTSGNRHLFRITAVDNGANTVTVHTAPVAISSGSPVSFAIGGERLHMENDTSRKDWADAESGWTYNFRAGTYTLTSAISTGAIGDHTDGPVRFVSDDPGNISVVFDRTTDFHTVETASGGSMLYDGITFSRSSGSSLHQAFRLISSDWISIRRCIINATGMDYGIIAAGENVAVYDTEIFGASVMGGQITDNCILERCSIHDNTSYGLLVAVNSATERAILNRNLFYDNGNSGVVVSSTTDTTLVHVTNNLFYGNSSHGFEISTTGGVDSCMMNFVGNSCVSNGGYGASIAADQVNLFGHVDYNHYYDNDSGARNNLPAGDNDQSGDPLFTNVTDGSENFTPGSGSPLLSNGAQAPTA